jgi:addiction module RelE/StbE family toxin
MPVTFAPEAVRDLETIRAYIGQDNPHAASRVSVALLAACDHLEYLPERGRPTRAAGTRELTTVWPYVITYQIFEGRVEILRIWHGGQDR